MGLRKNIIKIIFSGIVLSIGLLSICYFKRDIFTEHLECYTLEANIESKSKYKVVLVSNSPRLKINIKRELEWSFWKETSLDTLDFYDDFLIVYYRETKYLTRSFKEGNQYVPLYSHWNNTMDWRNHNEDRLGTIRLWRLKGGGGMYTISIKNPSYGFLFFMNSRKENKYKEKYKSIEDLYIRKCEELGIKKNDMEDDEEY